MPAILAEAVSISGGALFLILLVLVVTTAAMVAGAGWTAWLALRAGRGSPRARRGIVAVAALEALALLSEARGFVLALVALQVGAYLWGALRTSRPPAGQPVDPGPDGPSPP